MHHLPKIHLSPLETELINNTDWILAKQAVIKKVYEMFGSLQLMYKDELSNCKFLPDEFVLQNAKITKGENYLQLPYVILDYPATWKDIFAIRTMFWWGNFFSITLHISGKHKERFNAGIDRVFSLSERNSFFICVSKDEWQHHFKADNYKPATALTVAEKDSIKTKNFLKMAKKISLQEWDNAPEFLIKSFREIMQFLQTNYPDDKKDLLPVFPKAGSGL